MNEESFFIGHEPVFLIYSRLKTELLQRFPEMEIHIAKTQISFYDRRMFGCVSFTRVLRKAQMPDKYLTVTLCLPVPINSNRVAVKVEPYPGRWTHHVVVSDEKELDKELFSWFEEAHRFAILRASKP